MIHLQRSILILDDHPAQRLATVLLLGTLGYHNTYVAANGAAALDQLDQLGTIDIVLCDIRMSQMDGIAFLRQLAHRQLPPSILICSAADESLRRSLIFLASQLGLHVLGDVQKPIPANFLHQLLQRHVSKSAPNDPMPSMPPAELDLHLRDAFSLGDCITYYQPQYALQTLHATGVQLQCFWQHPTHGLLPSAAWMPQMTAQQRYAVSWHIAEQGLQLACALVQRPRPLNVSIPLHDIHLQSAWQLEAIQDYVERHRLSPTALSLELDATHFSQLSPAAIENLIRLRLKGCHLTMRIDALNVPSPRQLYELPFNHLMLDAHHLWPAENPSAYRADMAGVITAAAALGIRVITNNIDSWQQNQLLLHMGCPFGVGQWYASPMEEHTFSQWLHGADLQRFGTNRQSPTLRQRPSFSCPNTVDRQAPRFN
ncbi:EAL domain-containing protein [Collimonas sp. H4R21]|uniref:EAL domain-containing protein n=1 Tax=Collimonas rhizosphaerae TaxID=3126357 RepID=A0ABU9Q3D2_9BURK